MLDRAALTAVPGLLPGGPRPTRAEAGAGLGKVDPGGWGHGGKQAISRYALYSVVFKLFDV